ncbi:MAG: aspartate dehydrogenase [Clostridiaceae bacterium]|nr:aspartate dehydrogenase [Clostridiaceae bacterium]
MFKRRKSAPLPFDRTVLEPCIRKSICTGERAVGFRHRESGRFEEYDLIRTDADLARFLETYGLTDDEVKTIY